MKEKIYDQRQQRQAQVRAPGHARGVVGQVHGRWSPGRERCAIVFQTKPDETGAAEHVSTTIHKYAGDCMTTSIAPCSTPTAALLAAQQAAFRAEGPVSAATRQARLQRAIDMLVQRCDALCQAMGEDFGGRAAVFSMMNDVAGSLGSLKHARDHLTEWMPDQPRPSVSPFDNFRRHRLRQVPAQGRGRHHRHLECAGLYPALTAGQRVCGGQPGGAQALRNRATHRRSAGARRG